MAFVEIPKLDEYDVPQRILAEGDYLARAAKIEIQPTKAGDKNVLYVELDVLDGPVQADGLPLGNEKLFFRQTFPSPTDKDQGAANGRGLVKALKALNIFYNDRGFNTEEGLGVSVIAKVKHDEYQGEIRAKVDSLKPSK